MHHCLSFLSSCVWPAVFHILLIVVSSRLFDPILSEPEQFLELVCEIHTFVRGTPVIR